MSEDSKFKSRVGRLSCSAEEVYNFITDIRNFEQFVPEGKINNWQASSDSCSFQVPFIGSANVKISERKPFSRVVYSGDALKKNDFELLVDISENERRMADVSLFLTADINPFLKMMATGPIESFLETLISEMEKFDKWNNASKES